MAISFLQNVFYFSPFISVVDISFWIPSPNLNSFLLNHQFFSFKILNSRSPLVPETKAFSTLCLLKEIPEEQKGGKGVLSTNVHVTS